jgi:hypothetical protein
MNQLTRFIPEIKVPYYYFCIFPLLHEQIKNGGSASCLSLFPNLLFYSLPTYVTGLAKLPRMDSFDTAYLLGYQSVQAYLKIGVNIKNFADFETGMSALTEALTQQKLFIISGSSYFLPYFKDYRNPAYLENYPSPITGVADHWAAVYDLDDNHVFLYDPVPHHYLGAVPLDEFINFWKGNRGIPQFSKIPGIEKLYSFGYLDVEIKRRWTDAEIRELVHATLKTICYEYLEGTSIKKQDKEYYFGHSANRKFTEDIAHLPVCPDNASLIEHYVKCLCDSRFSRFHFGNLLRSAASSDRFFADCLCGYDSVITQWKKIGRLARKQIVNGNFDTVFFANLAKNIQQITRTEMNIGEKILKHCHASLLINVKCKEDACS